MPAPRLLKWSSSFFLEHHHGASQALSQQKKKKAQEATGGLKPSKPKLIREAAGIFVWLRAGVQTRAARVREGRSISPPPPLEG